MAESDSRERWLHTSHVMSLIANCHRDPDKGNPFTPNDYNPHHEGSGGADRPIILEKEQQRIALRAAMGL